MSLKVAPNLRCKLRLGLHISTQPRWGCSWHCIKQGPPQSTNLTTSVRILHSIAALCCMHLTKSVVARLPQPGLRPSWFTIRGAMEAARYRLQCGKAQALVLAGSLTRHPVLPPAPKERPDRHARKVCSSVKGSRSHRNSNCRQSWGGSKG